MRKWHPEKRNPTAIDARYWNLGADINKDGSLRIYRLPCGASAEGNKCIVFHQMDDEKNPEAVEIIQEGTGDALVIRTEPGGARRGGFEDDGAAITGSSEVLKENFKAIPYKSLEKMATKMTVNEWNFLISPKKRRVGPTAENFKEVTGYGDGETIPTETFLGITFRLVQLMWKKLADIEKQLKAPEVQKTKKELAENTAPEA